MKRRYLSASSLAHRTLRHNKNVSKLNTFAKKGNRSSLGVASSSPAFQNLFYGRVSAGLRKAILGPKQSV